MPIRIMLVDDHQIMREGLRALVERQPDIRVVGEASDGRTAVRLAAELEPDVIVMDVRMPDLNGIEAAMQIVRGNSKTRILALSMYDDRRYVLQALQAGVSGYMLKDAAFDELIKAIRAVASGKTWVSPSIANILVEDLRNPPTQGRMSAFEVLTDREREVLQLIAEGRSTKEIASLLGISIKTVEAHRQNIMAKLQLFSVAELTRYAISEGIITL